MVGTQPPPEVLSSAPVVYGAPSLNTATEELEASVEGARAVADGSAPGAWGDLPLVVVTAEAGGDLRFQGRLATLSTVSRHVVAEGTGHYVQYEQPQIVVDAIRGIMEQLR